MSRCSPSLCQVLEAGNSTGCHDIHLSNGSKIDGQRPTLSGSRSAKVEAPDVTLEASRSLTFSAPEVSLDTSGGTVTIAADTLTLQGSQLDLIVDGDVTASVGGRLSTRITGDSLKTTGGSDTELITGNIISRCDQGRSYETHGSVICHIYGNETGTTDGFNTKSVLGARTRTSASFSNTVTGDYAIVADTHSISVNTSFDMFLPQSPSPTTTSLHLEPEAIIATTPTFTIVGNLVVTGTIGPPPVPAGRWELRHITPPERGGGETRVSSEWSRLPGLAGDLVSSTGEIQFPEPGTYRLDGFVNFYAQDSGSVSVARLATGLSDEAAELLGTPIFGSGVSLLKGVIQVGTQPWILQYKSSSAHLEGLGRASGLTRNLHSWLEITRI